MLPSKLVGTRSWSGKKSKIGLPVYQMRDLISNRYQLHEQLGAGAMGVVHRATDCLTGEIVALKQITLDTEKLQFGSHGSGESTGTLRLALATEFRILAGLRHPHIISVIDYGFDDQQQPYFTMDYLPKARTVLEASAGKSTEEKVGMLVQILQALTYLHRRSILHRDLKPANILVSNGQVLVLDFGLSTPREAAQGRVGTPAYMAPETIHSGLVSEATDLYTLGALAYELFAGKRPFTNISDILRQEADLSVMVTHPDLSAVVGRLLQKDPLERYPSAQAARIGFLEAIGQPLPTEDVTIRESFLQAAAFVGRKAEMEQLTEALTQAINGTGSSWLVGGESGVGKSRLMDELRTQALVENTLVLRGQAVEGGGLPYQLWRDVIPHLVLSTPLSDLEAGVLKEIEPHIGALLGRDVPDAPELTGNAGRQRLAFTIVDVFRRQTRPIMLILEDLQWVTESLFLVKELIRIVSELPLLIVGNYRHDERPDLPDNLPGVYALILKRFSESEMTELSSAMLGAPAHQPELLKLLTQETEGNVFFLVEVVRALAEEAGSLWDIDQESLPGHVFTGGMRQILRRRVDRLHPDNQPLLQLAAVAGRHVDENLLHQMAPTMDVNAWLYQCASVAVLDVRGNRWQFTHDKLRELVVADLSDDQRPVLHRQVAEAIETVYSDEEEQAVALVHHWHLAENNEKELHYSFVAGEKALNTSAFHKALDYFARARELLPDQSAEQVPAILRVGEILFQQGEFNNASEQLEIGLSLANKYGDIGGSASALKHLGAIAREEGNYSKAGTFLEKSLSLARGINDHPNIASTLLELGWTEFRQGEFSVAREHFAESVTSYENQGDQRGLAAALNRLGGAVLRLGDYERAKSLRTKSLTICRELGDRWGEATALSNLGVGEGLQENYTESSRYYLEALKIDRLIGAQHLISIVLTNLGYSSFVLANYHEAALYFEEAIQLTTTMGAATTLLASLAGMASVWAKTGKEMRALEILGLIFAHPGLGEEGKTSAEQVLDDLRSQYSIDVINRVLEYGRTLDLETVVAEILANSDKD